LKILKQKFWRAFFLIFTLLFIAGGVFVWMFGPKIYWRVKNFTRGNLVWGAPDKEIRHSDNDIPVVVTTDDAYTLQTVVMLTSLFMNANPETFYKVDVLVTDEFSPTNKNKILSLQDTYKNCDIEFINMRDCFKNAFLSKHFSEVVYYRLRIPTVLEARKKCIYMDVDIVVKGDLTSLYNCDMGDNWLAGVADAGRSTFYENEAEAKRKEEDRKSMDLASRDQYINSGVLVFNLEAIRQHDVENKFKTFLQTHRDPIQHDQSTINSVAYGHIFPLKLECNVQMYMFSVKGYGEDKKKYSLLFSEAEWRDAWKNPLVMHFAGEKPWNDPTAYGIEEWWKVARQTPCWVEILQKFRTTK
jgi:lipopolysaccharide biosynthesis glycosyltransferase